MAEVYDSAEKAYTAGLNDRQPYLDRARASAALTLPFIIPPEGHGGESLRDPYQSVGPQGVVGLAAKLMMSHYPPGHSFVRFIVDPGSIHSLKEQFGEEKASQIEREIDQSLVDLEQSAINKIETSGVRPKLNMVFIHQLIAGNCLVHIPESGPNLQVWGLQHYTCLRDDSDNVLMGVLKRRVARKTLPQDLQALIGPDTTQASGEPAVDLYTAIRREPDGTFMVWTEVKGKEAPVSLPGSQKTYKNEDELPWKFVRMYKQDGEAYGYGYVNLMIGDLGYCERLRKTLRTMAFALSRILAGVEPGSSTNPKDLQKAKDLDVLRMGKEDVFAFNLATPEVVRAFGELKSEYRDQAAELGRAFLSHVSIQRNAERQTAFEWQILSQELESVLAGAYSQFAAEFQTWFVDHTLKRMQRAGEAPKFPQELNISPKIVTGVDALGRGTDAQKLRTWASDIAQVYGPEAVNEVTNRRNVALEMGNNVGLDVEGLLLTEQEIREQQQIEEMREIAGTLGAGGLQQLSAGPGGVENE